MILARRMNHAGRAPEGAIPYRSSALSLKRYPDTNLTCLLRGALGKPFHHKISNGAREKEARAPKPRDPRAVEQGDAGQRQREGDHIDQSEVATGDAESSRQIGLLAAQSPGGEDGQRRGGAPQPPIDADQLADR